MPDRAIEGTRAFALGVSALGNCALAWAAHAAAREVGDPVATAPLALRPTRPGPKNRSPFGNNHDTGIVEPSTLKY
jgi:hypothetical protein